jgi:hypothetical protein
VAAPSSHENLGICIRGSVSLGVCLACASYCFNRVKDLVGYAPESPSEVLHRMTKPVPRQS